MFTSHHFQRHYQNCKSASTPQSGTSHKTCLRGFGRNGSIAWTTAMSHEGRTSNAFKVTMKLQTFLFKMVVTSCISVQYLWKYGFAKSSDNLYAPCTLPSVLQGTYRYRRKRCYLYLYGNNSFFYGHDVRNILQMSTYKEAGCWAHKNDQPARDRPPPWGSGVKFSARRANTFKKRIFNWTQVATLLIYWRCLYRILAEYRISTWAFRGLLPSQGTFRIVLQLGYGCFLPNSFNLIIRKSSYESTQVS